MPFGSGQRMGDSIQAGLGALDFSGYERAGAIKGQALSNLGQDIGAGIKQYKDNEKTVKKAEQMAKAIRDAIPELAPMATNALNELNNPDLSLNDRLGIAEGIQDSLKIGVLGLEQNRANADFDFRKRQFATQLGMQQREMDALSNMPTKKNIVDVAVPGGQQQLLKDDYGNLYNLDGTPFDKNQIAPPDGIAPMGSPLPDNQTISPEEMKKFEALTQATPQVAEGNFPDWGSNEEARMIEEAQGMVSPPKPQPKSGTRIGFKADNKKDMSLMQEREESIRREEAALKAGKLEEAQIIAKARDDKPTATQERIGLLQEADRLKAAGDIKGADRVLSALGNANERQTALQERTQALKTVDQLYSAGNTKEALLLYNAIGLGGMFGKAIGMDEFQMVMDGYKQAIQAGQPTEPAAKPPLSELLKQDRGQ